MALEILLFLGILWLSVLLAKIELDFDAQGREGRRATAGCFYHLKSQSDLNQLFPAIAIAWDSSLFQMIDFLW